MMSSGHWARRAQSWLTEPSANSLKGPRPRDPTTRRSASLLTPIRASAAGGSRTRATTAMPGSSASAFATASSRIADSRRFNPATASTSMASCGNNVACTTSRVAPRKRASRAAHAERAERGRRSVDAHDDPRRCRLGLAPALSFSDHLNLPSAVSGQCHRRGKNSTGEVGPSMGDIGPLGPGPAVPHNWDVYHRELNPPARAGQMRPPAPRLYRTKSSAAGRSETGEPAPQCRRPGQAASGRTMTTDVASLLGLTSEEVAERIVSGRVNTSDPAGGRSLTQILRANVLTRFNAILGSLLVVVVFVGPLQDGLFGVVLAVNTAIGVAQEVRAKRTLDRLAVLTAPTAHGIRDGRPLELPADAGGARRCPRATARRPDRGGRPASWSSDGLEIDESLLSGEAVPVAKQREDEVRSGSFVVAGTGRMRATRVGEDAFAQQLQGDARRFSLVRSELQQGTNQILRMVTWVMIPAGVLLVTSQVLRSGQSLDGRAPGVGGRCRRHGARRVGASDDARLRPRRDSTGAPAGAGPGTGCHRRPRPGRCAVHRQDGDPDRAGHERRHDRDARGDVAVEEALGALVGSDPSPNATIRALASLPVPPDWAAEVRVPFSSARKWSAVQFAGRGSWVLGAPDVVWRRPVPSRPPCRSGSRRSPPGAAVSSSWREAPNL